MTAEQIRAAIFADTALQELVPDAAALATAMSVGRWRYRPTEVGKGTILETMIALDPVGGLDAGNGVIDAILSIPAYRHIKELLEQGRLRLDTAAAGGLLQPLVPGVMTQAQHDALCSRAREADPVSEYAVRAAIYDDGGSLLV